MIAHVKGVFRKFDASIYTVGKDFTTAEVDLWLDPSSIDTNNEARDKHLKSTDFFETEKHKQITFISSTIGEPDHEGNHELWGELTMVGITKIIKLNLQFGGIVHDPWGNEKAGFTVTGKINRHDWGLVWNTSIESAGLMVGEEVSVLCEIELKNIGLKDLTLDMEPVSLIHMHQKV